MRFNPAHASDDPALVRALVVQHPWAVLVSGSSGHLVASHTPILLDKATDELAVVTHLGRPDDVHHDLEHEVLVIVQGHHGYISPSWYAPGSTRAPTWNFTAAHLYGTPELLDPKRNLDVLTDLVTRFESKVSDPMWLDPDWARPVARGTVGLRIPIRSFDLKIKMSQDKDPETVEQVIGHLKEPGPYHHPALADDMIQARSHQAPRQPTR